MKMTNLYWISAIWAISSLATAQTIFQKKDKFSGQVHYYTEEKRVDLDGGSFFSMRYVYFDIHAYKPMITPHAPYDLCVHTHTPGWIFIRAGESLLLKLDGKDILPLYGGGSSQSREVLAGNEVVEIACWSLRPDQLNRISQAKVVEFRILGDRQNVTGTWKPDFLEDVILFAEKGPELIGDIKNNDSSVSAVSTSKNADVKPIKLGVQYVLVTKPLADSLKMPSTNGAFIAVVAAGSLSEKAGIKQGDVILKMGEKQILLQQDLLMAVASFRPGMSVPVTIWRNGAEMALNIQF